MQTLPTALAVLTLLLSLPAHAADIDVENQSSWEIHELYFSPSDEENWGGRSPRRTRAGVRHDPVANGRHPR